MFVAVARIPDLPDALLRASRVTGLVPADVSRLLAGTLPRILVRETTEAEDLARELEAEGFRAFAGDLARVPAGQGRVVARELAWVPGGFEVLDGRGERHACPGEAMALIQQGVLRRESMEVVTTTERKLALSKALLTGGLMPTKTVEKTTIKHELDKEPFVLVQRRDGGPDLIFQERRMNYACLGPDLKPVALANLLALLARLRAVAPGAAFDDRVGRPGFLTGLPLTAVDPLDLALYLVARAVALGC